MSYLIRDRRGTYYFRRVIPPALRAYMPPPWTGKREWKRSLRTKDPAVVKRTAAAHLAECMVDFEVAERRKRGEPVKARPTPTAILAPDDIERDVLAALLAEDETTRSDGDARKHLQTAEERAQWPDLVTVEFGVRGMMEDYASVYGEELEELAAEYRKANARSDPRIVDAETRTYLKQHGHPIDLASEDFRQAGLAVLRAHVRAYTMMLDRQRGDIVTTPGPSASKGPTLSEAFAAWAAGSGARGTRTPGIGTLQEARHAVRRLTEWHGDVRLANLTREQVREFRDALARMPTGLPAKLRALPLRNLLKRSDLKSYRPVHAATVNKSLTLLSAIVSHADAAGILPADFHTPFGRHARLAVDARAEQERQPFTTADLQAIFSTGVFTVGGRPGGGGGEAAFWLPIIALLSGARLGELAQLRVADLRQDPETGIWFFDIGTAGGRRVKTASSIRTVPVHPELLRVGLLDYRASLLTAGIGLDHSLWPKLHMAGDGQRGGPWSKWFNRHLRLKAGITDRAKVFHSFRHTFKRMARDAGLSEEQHDALTGHADGATGRTYGRGFGLVALKSAIEDIDAPAVVKELRWRGSPLGRTVHLQATGDEEPTSATTPSRST